MIDTVGLLGSGSWRLAALLLDRRRDPLGIRYLAHSFLVLDRRDALLVDLFAFFDLVFL